MLDENIVREVHLRNTCIKQKGITICNVDYEKKVVYINKEALMQLSGVTFSRSVRSVKRLKELFEQSIKEHGRVVIYSVLEHVSSSGMTRYISQFIPLITTDYNGKQHATIMCIAREKKIEGCGMDMGFALAYRMYHKVYEYNEKGREYQNYLSHSWM